MPIIEAIEMIVGFLFLTFVRNVLLLMLLLLGNCNMRDSNLHGSQQFSVSVGRPTSLAG